VFLWCRNADDLSDDEDMAMDGSSVKRIRLDQSFVASTSQPLPVQPQSPQPPTPANDGRSPESESKPKE